ncbi:hypothetical protein HAX54_003293, partial [Datura stramonium]|nr:hypothetical protein [Datura stramonium]
DETSEGKESLRENLGANFHDGRQHLQGQQASKNLFDGKPWHMLSQVNETGVAIHNEEMEVNVEIFQMKHNGLSEGTEHEKGHIANEKNQNIPPKKWGDRVEEEQELEEGEVKEDNNSGL